MGRKIGVAISGGGHRATLWGIGVLLYLVDSRLNRDVTTITSVSGGSIANGVVGLRTDYRTEERAGFRDAIRPLLKHITKDGLFFYGPKTNRYLAFTLGSVAASLAAWGLVVGLVVYQAIRTALDLLNWIGDGSLGSLTLWPVGIAIGVAFLALAVGAYLYAGSWGWSAGGVALGGMLIGAGLVAWEVVAAPIAWPMLPALAICWALALLITTVSLSAFGRRSNVAEKALREVHFGDATLENLGDRGGQERTRHVICATEMQSGLHAFFTDAFIYSYAFGISGKVGAVALARAVQASAALPGGFAPRRLETAELGFEDAGEEAAAPGRDRPMILLDGGVYDNMADQWFVGLEKRRDRWPAHHSSKLPQVEDLIIANASTGWIWQPLARLAQSVRVVREVAALSRIKSVMYNTIGRRRRAHLLDYWKSRPGEKGAFVEVNDNPVERATPALLARVEAIAPPQGWASLVERSRTYPTVLRRIDPGTAVEILWHAYLVTALSVNRFLERPVAPGDLPTLEEFTAGLGMPA